MIEHLPKLQRGDMGFFVERLQKSLMNWSLFSQSAIDGDFGPVTEAAVEKFQHLRPPNECKYSPIGLVETGVVDKNTWCELLKLKSEDIEITEVLALINQAQANAIFGTPIHYDELADLNACLQRFDITTLARIRHFIAQVAHESGGLRWFKELASGWDYEGRTDLGNTHPGDGPRFKGAGALQLTGRSNYQHFANFIGDPRVMEGVNYVAATYPFTSAGFWWYNNKMNSLIDQGATCRKVSARVNGCDPANGLDDRLRYYSITLRVIPS